jgi:parallel beta-helix repeat protein
LTGRTRTSLQASRTHFFITGGSPHSVRRVDAAGIIHTVAGTTSIEGSHGDGGYSPFAALHSPIGITLDADDNLYIADSYNLRVRRIETSYLWVSASPDRTKVGETFTYGLTLSGLPATATGVTLTAEPAAEVSFVDVTASQGSCAHSEGTVSCQLGTVEAGGTATVQITANAVGAGIIPITAMIGADDPDAIPGHRTVTAYTKISAEGCGQTITAATVLTHDLGPCVGDGIIVGANNVTLDLGGHRVFGFPDPGDGKEAGIRLPNRTGVTVSNGTVSDFDAGVAVYGGRANTVTNMTVRDNVGPDTVFGAELGDGIFLFDSAANRIIGNTVTGNGIFDGIGVWGPASRRNRIEGNTVTGSIGPSDRGPAGHGIIVNGADQNSGSIIGTVVSNNTVRGNGSGGIANINNVGASILNNLVEDNGFTNQAGNGIGVQMGPFARTQDSRVRVEGNQIHGNAESGIRIISARNTIIGNDASDNAVSPAGGRWGPAFDLEDRNPDCGTNKWSGNIWGNGGFSPACTTTDGSGPALSAEPATQEPSVASTSASQEAEETLPPSRRRPSAAGE